MWQTIGQSKALALFEYGLKTGSLAHAYLFVGPSHVGKHTLALEIAQALNCYGTEPPCGECKSCRRIADGKHADVTIISLNSSIGLKEAKSRVEIGIDDIKELQRSASLPPYEGKCKIFIIDGAEHLSNEASNCLLKTLEEPPRGVIIFLLTAEEVRLLPTVVSRCQRVELKPLPGKEIERVLIGSYGVNADNARLLAHLSQGCVGWALMASIDGSYLEQQGQRLSEILSLVDVSWEERFAFVSRIGNDRRLAEEIIKFWLVWWRDLMLAKCGCNQGITNINCALALEEWSQALSLGKIKDFIGSLQESLDRISRNANLCLVFETLMLDMPRKE